jgi:hypothetical protein
MIEHKSTETFDVSAETYWRELCLSLEYQEHVYREALHCTRMEVLEHTGGYEQGMKRRLRFTRALEAPAAIIKLFGSMVQIEEHSEFDAKAQRWSYRIVPAIMGDRLGIRGSVTLTPRPGGGVEQHGITNVTCRVFGLGSIIEHFVLKATEEGSTDKNNVTRRYIIDKGLTQR